MKIFKKAFSLVLALATICSLCLVFTVGTSAAVTATEGWEAEADGVFYISSPGDMLAWAANAQANTWYKDKTVKLTADIDMTSATWTQAASFRGTLDGQGHTISNLTVTSSGMFGNTGLSTFKNLSIVNSTFTGTHMGVFARDALASCSITFENVYVKANISNGGDYAGWIGRTAGSATTVNFINCVDESTVSGTYNGGCGAFFGQTNGSNNINFTNCVFKGDLSGVTSSGWSVAPFVGGARCNVNLTNCVSIGKLATSAPRYGALLGLKGGAASTVTIKDCYVANGLSNAIYAYTDANVFTLKIQYGSETVYSAASGTDLSAAISAIDATVERRTYSSDFSTYGYQFRADASSYDLRFIAATTFENLEDYSEVGFEVTVTKGGETLINRERKGTATVYTSILAGDKTYTAGDLLCDYLYGAEIRNFKNDETYTVVVVAYAKKPDGSFIYGSDGMTALTVKNGTALA